MGRGANRKSSILGTCLILLAALLWGSSFAVRKMGMDEIGPLMQNAARFFVAFLFMLAVLWIKNSRRSYNIERTGEGRTDNVPSVRTQILRGIIIGSSFAIAAMLQQLGLNLAAAGQTGFITSMYTVLVPVISCVFLKEKMTGWIVAAMICSVGGLYFITGGISGISLGIIILFGGSIFYALQIILIDRLIHGTDPVLLVTVQVAMGTLINLAAAILTREPFEWHMLIDGGPVILYAGIMSLGVANLCQFAGQQWVSPQTAAIGCSFESVFGLLFGILLLGERFTLLQLIGCALIFASLLLSQKTNV